MSEVLSTVGVVTRVGLITTAILALAWLASMAASLASRAPHPKSGLRRSDFAAIVTSFLLAMGVVLTMTAPSVETKAEKETSAPAAAASRGTCASIQTGMKSSEVRRALGEPDEVRPEEDVRGPKAEAWIYEASRCSVHVLAGRVDFID